MEGRENEEGSDSGERAEIHLEMQRRNRTRGDKGRKESE